VNKWIQSAVHPSRKGDFTRKAKRAGMSVQKFAMYVLAHPEKYSKLTRYQARFARRMKEINE